MDSESASEHAPKLAALVERAVSMHEDHGWAGPEHSTVDCAMWALGQFESDARTSVTGEIVAAATAHVASLRDFVAGLNDQDTTEQIAAHARHVDGVLAVLSGYCADR